MKMSEMKSPLARLVLFMVCLSVAGAFVAGVHYIAVVQPQQNIQNTPTNWGPDICGDKLFSCIQDCKKPDKDYGNVVECEMECRYDIIQNCRP